MGHYTKEILRNAEKINYLKKRIDESVKFRDKNEHKRKEWQRACSEFRLQYDSLAFPGGYKGAYGRITSGNHKAIEAALCFLECRPYFFRSGYIFKGYFKEKSHIERQNNNVTKTAAQHRSVSLRLDAL